MWFCVVTGVTVGYGDKVPRSTGGKIFSGLWMISAVILVSIFVGTMTSIMTVSKMDTSVKGPDDLYRVKTGTVRYSTSDQYLKNKMHGYETFDNVEEGMKELAAGKLDAFVYDDAMIRYIIQTNYTGCATIIPASSEQKQPYGIAMPMGSPMRKPIDLALLKITGSSSWDRLLESYLGKAN